MGSSPANITMSHAALVQMLAKVINVILQLAITMVLARILTPQEYGTVAIISVFTGLFACLSNFGISSAIVQYKDVDREDCQSLMLLSLVAGIVLSLLFVCTSFVISYIYNDQVYISLGYILTIAVLFGSLNMVPNGLLLRERRFVIIGLRSIVVYFIAGLVAIFLAYLGFGVYALALNSVIASILIFVWNAVSARIGIGFKNFIPALRKIAKFSVFQYGHQIASYLSGYIDTLMIGRFFGQTDLGYYNKATTLSMMPIEYIAAPVTNSMQPYLAEKQDDKESMYHSLQSIARSVFLLTVPCGLLLSLCSSELIPILFGDNWDPAIPVLQILATAIAFRAINWVHGSILISSARTDLLMLSTFLNAGCILAASIVGVCLGSFELTALLVAIAYFAELIICIFICVRICLSQSIWSYVSKMLPMAGAGLLALLLTWFFANLLSLDSVLILVFKICVFSIMYFLFCILFGQRELISDVVRALIKKKAN